jgi:hypothetical protein
MPLHPFATRKKRLENALTLGGLFGALLIVFVIMALAGPDGDGWSWGYFLRQNWHFLAGIPAGMIALIVYVRGGAKQ